MKKRLMKITAAKKHYKIPTINIHLDKYENFAFK